MTTSQKSRIIYLRKNGESYSKIAADLNISENTIKSFCRRSNLVTVSDVCANCEKPMPASTGTKKKRFCSNDCRVAWWNSHPEAVKQKAIYSFICRSCGKPFTAYGNKNRKFCTHICYVNTRFGNGKAGQQS